MASESCDPCFTAGGAARRLRAGRRWMQISQALSWCLSHEQNPPPRPLRAARATRQSQLSPCQRATGCAQTAAVPVYLPLCQQGKPQQGKRGQQGLRHIAGVEPHNQDPRSVCMLVASKCLSPGSGTGTAAVAHTAQSNVGHDTTTPVLFSEASGHCS